jgi:hypothetical protein
MLRPCVVVAVALLAACGREAQPPVEILGARIGVMQDLPVPQLVDATKVVLGDGAQFAWILSLRTDRATLAYTEEITLAAPYGWVMAPGVRYDVSPDRRGIRVFHKVAVKGASISGMWSASPDLPPGRVALRIVVEDQAEQKLEFELVRP